MGLVNLAEGYFEALEEPRREDASLELLAPSHAPAVLVDCPMGDWLLQANNDELWRTAGSVDSDGVREGWEIAFLQHVQDVATVLRNIINDPLFTRVHVSSQLVFRPTAESRQGGPSAQPTDDRKLRKRPGCSWRVVPPRSSAQPPDSAGASATGACAIHRPQAASDNGVPNAGVHTC